MLSRICSKYKRDGLSNLLGTGMTKGYNGAEAYLVWALHYRGNALEDEKPIIKYVNPSDIIYASAYEIEETIGHSHHLESFSSPSAVRLANYGDVIGLGCASGLLKRRNL